ncbi:MAG: hypothetical protein WC521_07680 [Bdellovibrionales bacterium]|jgi:hypothetical protein
MGQKENFDSRGDATTASKFDDIISGSSTSLVRSLVGPIGDVGDFFFPPDVVGGVCPRVAGEEESIVWNAAAEACDSERVHVVWQSVGNCIWYLAVKSSDLVSHTNSWCPLAALLPTKEDIGNLPVCYTYFGEELAVLMMVGAEELHIFRGTAPVIRAKAERIVREYGEKTRTITIDPFRIGQMKPVPWYSASLFEDRARRILAAASVFTSLSIVGLSFVIWLLASMTTISARHDLSAANERTQGKVTKLLQDAQNMRSSPLREQIERFLNVNDGLLSLNGFLTVYSVKEKVIRWKALVPPSATADRISAMGGKNIETTEKGVVIGNDAQIEYESMNRGRR